MRGSYTPLPSSVGGQVVAAVGGETIDRWPTDSTGVIDRWVDVPDRVLQRYTNLGVAINISGNTGRCGEFQPITLTIDGDSPLQSSLAKPPAPSGFQALPQALMPRVEIGMGDGFDDTRRAVTILVALQRLSALPIDTAVTSLQDAIASPNPAVLIEATGWSDGRVTLPVATNSDGDITVENVDRTGESGTLALNPALRFGSLQTMYDGNRTLLVATSNNAPDQLDALLRWIDSNVERWSRVTGTAVIAVPDRAPVVFSTESPRQSEHRSTESQSMLFWGVGAAATVLFAAGVTAILMRGKRPSRPPVTVTAQTSDRNSASLLSRYYEVHPTYRLIVRWALIALLTASPSGESFSASAMTAHEDGLGGYVWTVPTAGDPGGDRPCPSPPHRTADSRSADRHHRRTVWVWCMALLIHGRLAGALRAVFSSPSVGSPRGVAVRGSAAASVFFGLRPGQQLRLGLGHDVFRLFAAVLLRGDLPRRRQVRCRARATLLLAGVGTGMAVGRTLRRGLVGSLGCLDCGFRRAEHDHRAVIPDCADWSSINRFRR